MKSIIAVVASSMFAVTAFAQAPAAPAKKEEAKPAAAAPAKKEAAKPAATKPAPPVIPPAPAKKDEKKAEPAKK